MSGKNVVGCGQLCFLSSQITGIFDHQYVWQKSRNLLDFLHVDIYQAKASSDTSTFGCVLPVCLLSNQIAGILDHQYFWQKSRDLLDFLHGDSYQVKAASETIAFG